MLDLIGEIIYNSDMEDDCEEIADKILKVMEQKGMLPPRTAIPGTPYSDNYWERE